MNNLFNITFNGLNDIDDLGIMATTRPNIPTPVRKIQEKECNGRDGKLHQDLGGYDDMELMISYNFSSRDKYFEILRKLKRWTNHIEDNKLFLSDMKDWHYKVKFCKLATVERVYKTIGRFELTFIIEPYLYKNNYDSIAINSISKIYNEYELCKPTYKLEGEGYINLTINDKTVKINLGQNLTIDTDFQECYREGLQAVDVLEGDYEDMWLQEGVNTISYTPTDAVTKFEIIPNWRCL